MANESHGRSEYTKPVFPPKGLYSPLPRQNEITANSSCAAFVTVVNTKDHVSATYLVTNMSARSIISKQFNTHSVYMLTANELGLMAIVKIRLTLGSVFNSPDG